MCRNVVEKQQNGDRSRTIIFAFYSEPANQNPRLVVSGPRKNAKPSVNDKLRSYTVTACPKFGAPF